MKNREPEQTRQRPPMLGIVGYSGSGKTTLVVGLIECFGRRGLRVATIKHDVHGFEMDRPGKDTWLHKQAGAVATVISSRDRIGLVRDVDRDHRPEELLSLLGPVDLVLVEGFKRAPSPQIEVYRPDMGVPPACLGEECLAAVVCDEAVDWGVPRFSTGGLDSIADFIEGRLGLISRKTATPKY